MFLLGCLYWWIGKESKAERIKMMMVMIIYIIIIENVPSTCIQNLVRDPHPKLHSWLLRYTHTYSQDTHEEVKQWQ